MNAAPSIRAIAVNYDFQKGKAKVQSKINIYLTAALLPVGGHCRVRPVPSNTPGEGRVQCRGARVGGPVRLPGGPRGGRTHRHRRTDRADVPDAGQYC